MSEVGQRIGKKKKSILKSCIKSEVDALNL